jgi:glutathione S-transferase
VPALILDEDGIITLSSAIPEYLEEAYSAQSPEKSFRLLRAGRGGLDCHTGGQGLASVEALIDDGFCFGPEPMLVDVCRLPQLCAARRFGVPLEAYPRILRVEKVAGEHPAFLRAHPSNQPDAE